MPVEWVTAAPEPILEEIGAAVRDSAGAVVAGPAGVGKTSLARAAAERVGGQFGRVDWVIGTRSTSAVPFAAFGPLFEVPSTGRLSDVLRSVRDSLSDGRLLIVDDAHLLDALSATLLHQLAVCGGVRMIVTVDPAAEVPDGVRALWRVDALVRVDVGAPGHDPARLAAQVQQYIRGLPASARQLLAYLAVAEPLPLSIFGEDEGVSAACTSGAVFAGGDTLRAAHPLYTDAVGAELTEPEQRRLRNELFDRLAADPPADPVGQLRLAVLALDSDRQQPAAELSAAAEDALRLGDLSLGERLGRVAVANGPGLAARLPLAYALTWQGRGRDADAVLAEVDAQTLSETDLMAWALLRAANQFWMLSEPERATAFLRTVRERVSTPRVRTTLDALSATFAMNAGQLQQAMRISTEVLASRSADDTAVGWAAAAAALSAARMGRFDEVDSLAERAMGAGHPGLLRFTSGFGQTTTLMMAGDLGAALALAQRLTGLAQLQQPGRAIGDVLIADVLIMRGELDAAVPLLREAAAALAPTGYSWGPLAWMLLARALGEQGETAAAAKVLTRAESRHGLKSMMFAPELALARAWTMSARGDRHAAIAAARGAVRTAERGSQSAVALRAAHDAARLGDIRAVDTVDRLSTGLTCRFADLVSRHARALATRDAAALQTVSADLAALGLRGAAADAATQAEGVRG